MKRILLIISFFVITLDGLYSQSKVIIKVLDSETLEAVANAGVMISKDKDKLIKFTDSNGIAVFNNLDNCCYYIIEIERIDYNYHYADFIIEKEVFELEILLENDNKNIRTNNISKNDIFDVSILTFSILPSDNNFKYSYPISFYAFENRFKINDFMQFGMRTSLLEFSWLRISDDINILSTPDIKERYFTLSASYFIYQRFIITKNAELGIRGLFFDYGIGYRIPYYSAYSNFTNKKSRFTEKGIYNFNDFELMGRIGYSNFSIFANYRLTDIAKSGFIEPPKINIGIDILINFAN